MANCSVILLGIFVLTCGTATSGQQVKMSIQGTDDILQKLQPQIGQISKLMATSVGHGTPETEGLISKHITQSLGVVLEKWETQNVLEVGNGKSVNSWLESAKNQLQASLADLMENINAEKSKCCTCIICKRKTTLCFNPFCCAQGGKLCKCITCSAGRGELVASMDSVSDSTNLTEGTQPALDRISALFDNLLLLVNIP